MSTKASGSVLIPVASAMRTRRLDSSARKTGKTRSGLDATLSSSRNSHSARTGGSAPRKLADMSSASNVPAMPGKVLARKEGTALGVVDEPIRRCVVPGANQRIRTL